MADIVQLPMVPATDDSLEMLLDLRRSLDAGGDLGSRMPHIRQALAATRAYAGGLRRALEAPDDGLADQPELRAMGEKMLAVAERNIAAVEEMLRVYANHPP